MQNLSLEKKETHAVSVQKGKTPSDVRKKKAYHKPADTVKGTRQLTAATAEGPKCSNCGYVNSHGQQVSSYWEKVQKVSKNRSLRISLQRGSCTQDKGQE